MPQLRVGVIGYGHLGKFLVDRIQQHPELELVFVWNRTSSALRGHVSENLILENINDFTSKEPHLVVEVAHPNISKEYGAKILHYCDYFVGSPTALADSSVETDLRLGAQHNGLYVPSGAFWGGEDIQRMADRGTISGLKVTMKKHPSAFKLVGSLVEINKSVTDTAVELYSGPVRELCSLAPNNVNTMAAAAIAAHNLGFDKVVGSLVSDPGLLEYHVVEVDVTGPETNGNLFTVNTVRRNPAAPGEVTGSATFNSFFSSLLRSRGQGPGVHLC